MHVIILVGDIGFYIRFWKEWVAGATDIASVFVPPVFVQLHFFHRP